MDREMRKRIYQKVTENWSKPFKELPVNKDLQRLVSGMRMVETTTNTVFFEDDPNQDRMTSCLDILRVLSALFPQALETGGTGQQAVSFTNYVSSKFPEYVRATGDNQLQLARFFRDLLDEDGQMCRILKCCQQEIIAPAVMMMRSAVYQSYPYKDKKGTWKITISLYRPDAEGFSIGAMRKDGKRSHSDIMSSPRRKHRSRLSSTSGVRKLREERKVKHQSTPNLLNLSVDSDPDLPELSSSSTFSSVHSIIARVYDVATIEGSFLRDYAIRLFDTMDGTYTRLSVTHTKWEQSHVESPSLYFCFQWSLCMQLNPQTCVLEGVTFGINRIEFTDEVNATYQQAVLEALRPWFLDRVAYNDILRSPPAKVKFHSLLPEICKSVQFKVYPDTVIFEANAVHGQSVYNILLILFQQFGCSSAIDCLTRSYATVASETDVKQISKKMNKLFRQILALDECPTNVLKLLAMLSNKVYQIGRDSLQLGLSDKDCFELRSAHAASQILVNVLPMAVRVVHMHQEQATIDFTGGQVQFVLKVCLVLDRETFDIVASNLEILDYRFVGNVKETRKLSVVDTLTSYLHETSTERDIACLPVSTVLSYCREVLAGVADEVQTVDRANLPPDVTVYDLLTVLQDHLETNCVKPPPMQYFFEKQP